MIKNRPPYFWLLLLMTVFFMGFQLRLAWHYSQAWLHGLWLDCQNWSQYLADNIWLSWQLLVPLTACVIVSRAMLSIGQQLRATHRMATCFGGLQTVLPSRLHRLLDQHDLSSDEVVYLKFEALHIFCLGFIRPRIWVTSGLVERLSDEELSAVLAHEKHHSRQRDPLRLLVSRALQSAFFFLPFVTDLAKVTELQQEIAADQAAIATLGDDLPLLCALQKLLQQSDPNRPMQWAAYSPFNVTQARLERLLDAKSTSSLPIDYSRWLLSLSLAFMVSVPIGVSISQPTEQLEPKICSCSADAPLMTLNEVH